MMLTIKQTLFVVLLSYKSTKHLVILIAVAVTTVHAVVVYKCSKER